MVSRRGIRLWFRWVACRRQARRWLRHNDADKIVAAVMWHLNVAAAHLSPSFKSSAIYALKNRLIQHFYQAGYTSAVQLKTQKALCWRCEGTGDFYGEECWKCEGTGIYRIHHLYLFVFRIAGRTYAWHQPTNQVEYDVTLTDDIVGAYQARTRDRGAFLFGYPGLLVLYYLTVYEYLRQRGYEVAPDYDLRPRLGKCIVEDWSAWASSKSWLCKLSILTDQVRNWLQSRPHKNVERGFVEETEIPF